MISSKKKKANVNGFKKVVQKVGKEKKDAVNATNTNFSAKKIVMPNQGGLREKGEFQTSRNLNLNDLLSHLRHTNMQMRQNAVSGIQELVAKFPQLLFTHLGTILEGITPVISDPGRPVRTQLRRLIMFLLGSAVATCSETDEGDNGRTEVEKALAGRSSAENLNRRIDLTSFFPLLHIQIKAALSHVDKDIQQDGLRLLADYFEHDLSFVLQPVLPMLIDLVLQSKKFLHSTNFHETKFLLVLYELIYLRDAGQRNGTTDGTATGTTDGMHGVHGMLEFGNNNIDTECDGGNDINPSGCSEFSEFQADAAAAYGASTAKNFVERGSTISLRDVTKHTTEIKLEGSASNGNPNSGGISGGNSGASRGSIHGNINNGGSRGSTSTNCSIDHELQVASVSSFLSNETSFLSELRSLQHKASQTQQQQQKLLQTGGGAPRNNSASESLNQDLISKNDLEVIALCAKTWLESSSDENGGGQNNSSGGGIRPIGASGNVIDFSRSSRGRTAKGGNSSSSGGHGNANSGSTQKGEHVLKNLDQKVRVAGLLDLMVTGYCGGNNQNGRGNTNNTNGGNNTGTMNHTLIAKTLESELAPVLADFPLSANSPPQVNRVQYRQLVDAANLHMASILLKVSSSFVDLAAVESEILRIAESMESGNGNGNAGNAESGNGSQPAAKRAKMTGSSSQKSQVQALQTIEKLNKRRQKLEEDVLVISTFVDQFVRRLVESGGGNNGNNNAGNNSNGGRSSGSTNSSTSSSDSTHNKHHAFLYLSTNLMKLDFVFESILKRLMVKGGTGCESQVKELIETLTQVKDQTETGIRNGRIERCIPFVATLLGIGKGSRVGCGPYGLELDEEGLGENGEESEDDDSNDDDKVSTEDEEDNEQEDSDSEENDESNSSDSTADTRMGRKRQREEAAMKKRERNMKDFISKVEKKEKKKINQIKKRQAIKNRVLDQAKVWTSTWCKLLFYYGTSAGAVGSGSTACSSPLSPADARTAEQILRYFLEIAKRAKHEGSEGKGNVASSKHSFSNFYTDLFEHIQKQLLPFFCGLQGARPPILGLYGPNTATSDLQTLALSLIDHYTLPFSANLVTKFCSVLEHGGFRSQLANEFWLEMMFKAIVRRAVECEEKLKTKDSLRDDASESESSEDSENSAEEAAESGFLIVLRFILKMIQQHPIFTKKTAALLLEQESHALEGSSSFLDLLQMRSDVHSSHSHSSSSFESSSIYSNFFSDFLWKLLFVSDWPKHSFFTRITFLRECLAAVPKDQEEKVRQKLFWDSQSINETKTNSAGNTDSGMKDNGNTNHGLESPGFHSGFRSLLTSGFMRAEDMLQEQKCENEAVYQENIAFLRKYLEYGPSEIFGIRNRSSEDRRNVDHNDGRTADGRSSEEECSIMDHVTNLLDLLWEKEKYTVLIEQVCERSGEENKLINNLYSTADTKLLQGCFVRMLIERKTMEQRNARNIGASDDFADSPRNGCGNSAANGSPDEDHEEQERERRNVLVGKITTLWPQMRGVELFV